jgi:hypothetical protein
MAENKKNNVKSVKNSEKIAENSEKPNKIVKVKFLRSYCGLHGIFLQGQRAEFSEDVANRLISTRAAIKEV